jgi:pimeloyl-ACP methyl ester carboxylesterase
MSTIANSAQPASAWDDRGMRPGLAACAFAALLLPGHADRWGRSEAGTGTGTGTGTSETPSPPALTPAAGPTPTAAASLEPTDAITTLSVDDDLPVFVVPPAPGARPARTVFLTGSCTTPLTYLSRFREAAAAHGGIIALQGDKLCRDGSRRWSPDTIGTAARIDAALRAAGFDDLTDITLVGYSQGAERAEWLAHRFPAKYTRFILMAGPILPSHARFSDARAVVTLAGYGDVRENMANGAKRLRRAAIPAIYMELPGVQHGELAPAANDVVARAFD